MRSAVMMGYYSTVAIWHESLSRIIPLTNKAFDDAVNSGDFESAGFNATNYIGFSYHLGKYLPVLSTEAENYAHFLWKNKQQTSYFYTCIYWHLILKMLAEDPEVISKSGSVFDEKALTTAFITRKDNAALAELYLSQLIYDYLLHNANNALQLYPIACQYADQIKGQIEEAMIYFYAALSALRYHGRATSREKKSILNITKKSLKKIQYWAKYAPMNYQHKYYLVYAELLRVKKNYTEAALTYDKSIKLAKEHGYLSDEALGNELAALLQIQLDNEIQVHLYAAKGFMNSC